MAKTICFDSACGEEIIGPCVWLGEVDEESGIEYTFPFHPSCADQPWPLYETRKELIEAAQEAGMA